ncbi:MAG: GNAT family N-acetyltransferase [Polyangiaceae bacterium]
MSGHEEGARVEDAHAALVRAGVVEHVALGGEDERAWLDCDLASLAEHRLEDRRGPIGIDAPTRETWQTRATTEPPYPLARREAYERCYWLLEGGARAGTIALATAADPTVRLSSLYVFPSFRRRGVGRRAMHRVIEALAARALGLRLDTSWSWQRTVRFYFTLGGWVRFWRRDLEFVWDGAAPPLLDVGHERATISARGAQGAAWIATARRRGALLELDVNPVVDAPFRERALGTLALAIALEGFPLVRSRSAWEESCYEDLGAPEALAYRIVIWEAWEKRHGYVVRTPRIPRLRYPAWDELESGWSAGVPAWDLALGPH